MTVKLVWDGAEITVPEEMGCPHSGQMVGTDGEQLIELSCRICYDSVGSGRASAETIAHVLEARHLSVLEHYNRTIQLDFGHLFGTEMAGGLMLFPALFNRPGLWVRPTVGGLRLTMNARTAYEWFEWTSRMKDATDPAIHGLFATVDALGAIVWRLWMDIMPMVFHDRSDVPDREWALLRTHLDDAKFVTPETAHEEWISLYISGSRGMSHELVRHGDWTAISQRSTRYVEENESDWAWHPAIAHYLSDAAVEADQDEFRAAIHDCEKHAKRAYAIIRDHLETWLRPRCEIKRDARKQARGAARGALGNALNTELIFSASCDQWMHILRMRGSLGADAEIREIAVAAHAILSKSRYGNRFSGLTPSPSPDGLGQVLT